MPTLDVRVPHLGDVSEVPVVELPLKAGDSVAVDDTVAVLESDKATLDVPSPAAGRITQVCVTVGDRVSEGTRLLVLEVDSVGADRSPAEPHPPPAAPAFAASGTPTHGTTPEGVGEVPHADRSGCVPPSDAAAAPTAPAPAPAPSLTPLPHASPAVRRIAREVGIDLAGIAGTGPKGRITKDDVKAHVRRAVEAAPAPAADPTAAMVGAGLPPWPRVDYAAYGPVERVALPRIARLSGPNLARNALVIPHVTSFEDADVTDLEAFRRTLNAEREGVRLSLLAFVVKAVAATLTAFPAFNASLDGDALILKRYVNIGIAADTEEGLVVPVLRDSDRKGVLQIAEEIAELAAAARAQRLKGEHLEGGTFTVSSLGGIGGTGFTPIIAAPQVAILGLVRAAMKPVWDGAAFQPRLVLPLSLSWDHRAVDGVAAARMLVHLKTLLGDFRRIAL